MSILPTTERATNYAWIVCITVAAILIVGGAFLFAVLVYQERQIPRELVLVVSGIGTLLTNAAILFVGRQAKANHIGTEDIATEIKDGVSTDLAKIKDAQGEIAIAIHREFEARNITLRELFRDELERFYRDIRSRPDGG